mmetsp:Transcript_17195/g.35476  ORF Transcript_17195/g.35476 Transcript_17195/m.35476 type:complete len:104 (-) Transcript_17195:548-859(-)
MEDAIRIRTAIKYGIITGIAMDSTPRKLRRLSYLSCRRIFDILCCSTSSFSLKETRFLNGGNCPLPAEEYVESSVEVAVVHDMGEEASLYPGGGSGGGSGRRG